MSKKLDTTTIANELEGSAFFPTRGSRVTAQPAESSAPPAPPMEPTNAPTAAQPVPAEPSVDRPVDQPVAQTLGQPTEQPTNKVVGRPKAFYITERIDAKLDEAVRYFQDKHGIKRVDRSAVVNALLSGEEVWEGEALDRAVSRLVSQLTSRLVR